MDEKAFSLMELIAAILLVSLVAIITRPIFTTIFDGTSNMSFKRDVQNAINSFTFVVQNENAKGNKITSLSFDDERLNIENNKFISGSFYYNKKEKNFAAVNISDGIYCANGVIDNLYINKGACDANINDFTITIDDSWSTTDKEIILTHPYYKKLSYYISTEDVIPSCNDANWSDEIILKPNGHYYAFIKSDDCKISQSKNFDITTVDTQKPYVMFNGYTYENNSFVIPLSFSDGNGSGISSDNNYQFCLSKVEYMAVDCVWYSFSVNDNAADITVTLDNTDINSTTSNKVRYLYIKDIKDNLGNYSNNNNNIRITNLDFTQFFN